MRIVRYNKIKTDPALPLMLVAPVLVLFIFAYLPMAGLIMAFQDFQPARGFANSHWVGFENFLTVFMLPDTGQVITNTVIIAIQKIIANLLVPVIFALLLNEVRNAWFKKTVQTLTYLPYFLSWVVLGGILYEFLSPSGFINTIIKDLGGSSIFFLGNNDWFRPTLVVTDVWKNFGFNTIVYLAALTAVDPSLYEVASIDGAGRWRQTLAITIPGIAPIVALMTILSLGNILNGGFDQVFNLYSPMVYASGDILDTLVYRLGFVSQQYSLSTAVGLFKSIVALVLILLSYRLAEKYTDYRIF